MLPILCVLFLNLQGRGHHGSQMHEPDCISCLSQPLHPSAGVTRFLYESKQFAIYIVLSFRQALPESPVEVAPEQGTLPLGIEILEIIPLVVHPHDDSWTHIFQMLAERGQLKERAVIVRREIKCRRIRIGDQCRKTLTRWNTGPQGEGIPQKRNIDRFHPIGLRDY